MAVLVGAWDLWPRKVEAEAVEKVAPPAVVVALAPDGRRQLFFALDRSISAVAKRGSKACRKATWALDAKFETAGDSEPRTLLRARCALCPDKCKRPLA